MELRELAERILYGTTLDEKLVVAEALTDARPGEAVALPPRPGRPEPLRLDQARERVAFPGATELDRPGARGRVLHFFANHELLAAELMALALLRFPDAPRSFRMGLARTIADEQRHLRLYLERMRADGVALGEIPVSAFFWDCLRDVASPTDFVAGMSLTFEQANLDFSRAYADAFRACGDASTADALERVYEDELLHVGRGLAFFERTRGDDDARDTFEAWRARLTWPLTPARGRGRLFDAEGRRRAGLSEDFIDQMRVFGASKGRPPSVFSFDPSCEHAWLHGTGSPLGREARALEEDLDLLPLVLARHDDVVLVRRRPSIAFLRSLAAAGFAIPELVTDVDAIEHPHVASLEPWGWAPDVATTYAPLARRLRALGRPLDERVAIARRVNRKSFALRVMEALREEGALGELGDRRGGDDPRVDLAPGALCDDAESALDAIAAGLSQGRVMRVKGERGTSGRHQRRVMDEAELPDVRRWIANQLARQPGLVVEPELERRADLSVLARVDAEGSVVVEGITRFLVDARGRYRGTVLGAPSFGLDERTTRFLHGEGREPRFVATCLGRAARAAGRALAAEGYVGPFGVDAFVHETAGVLRLRPVIEVNARYTMGHVGLALTRRLAPGVGGLFALLRVRETGPFAAFASRLSAELPVRPGARTGRLEAGAVFLNDPSVATEVLAVMVVGTPLSTLIQSTLIQRFGAERAGDPRGGSDRLGGRG